MQIAHDVVRPRHARSLLGDTAGVADAWLGDAGGASTLALVGIIVLCGGAAGAAMGAWRDPLLALYVAIKLPVLLLATALVAALANGIWARWFGLDLSLLRSLRAVLMSFALASVVLAALAPVVLLFGLTLPDGDDQAARIAHDWLGLAHVAAIALAGVVAVRRQAAWVAHVSPRAHAVGAVIALWLVINLSVGAQLSWNLRPWFGSPGMQTTFLREQPFDGTFYESVLKMMRPH
jgi:hypothetical protein